MNCWDTSSKIIALLFSSLIFSGLNAQVILTEIMFDCASDEYHDEYVEIYNTSMDHSVDLTNWQISDSVESDILTDAGEGMLLLPGRYAVILDGSYFGNSVFYDNVIPDSALIIKIDDGAFGRSGLSNSTPRKVSLITSAGDTAESYRYTLDNSPGFPDEKILLTSDNSGSNWGNGLHNGGTPGFRNSLTPCSYDLALTGSALTIHPSVLIQTLQNVQVTCKISNIGLQTFTDSVQISVIADADPDSMISGTGSVIIRETIRPDLGQGEDEELNGIWIPQVAGTYLITAQIISDADQNAANNCFALEVYVAESTPSLVLNEIKFLTTDDEPEWIEVLNKGDQAVSLRHWGISDNMDTVWIDSSMYLHPGQYKVFASDTGLVRDYEIADSLICVLPRWTNLNNDGDLICLLNPAGGWAEQVAYTKDWLEGEDWHYPSLERIHYEMDSRLSTSWGPSTAISGGTPGAKNSIMLIRTGASGSVNVEPNPFSPDGDGHEDHTVISFHSPVTAAKARVEIFDAPGRKVRTILDNSFAGPDLTVVWNGKNDQGERVRMGIYIIWIQILDDRNGVLKEFRSSVVVAGKL